MHDWVLSERNSCALLREPSFVFPLLVINRIHRIPKHRNTGSYDVALTNPLFERTRTIQMNNNRPRPATPRAGGGTSVLKQIKGKQAANETNDTPASTVKEGIVQKLQGVLFAVRRDRDREHRNRDIAMEKLRSAKELYETDKSNFEAEKEKLAKTQEEAEKTQQEILEKEKIVAELQQKVREAK